MNQGTLAGHLGADPEVRFTSSGQKVTSLRVAARVRKGTKDKTIWWQVSVWGEQFDKMLPHFKKGSSIVVVGEMHVPEIFTDREGRPQVSMSMTAFHIGFSPFGKPDQVGRESHTHHSPATSDTGFRQDEDAFAYRSGKIVDEVTDEVPF